MTIQLSIAVLNARLDAIESTVGTAPKLQFYTGTPPANCAAAATGTLLAELTLPSDWMGNAASGSKAKSGTWSGTCSATGTIGYFRLMNSAKTTCHAQGNVTAAGGGGTMTVSNVSVASGQTISVTTFSMTAAQALVSRDNVAPSVSLTASSTTVNSAGTITLSATATDNVAVARVEFYKAGVLIGTATSAPYTQDVSFTSADNGVAGFFAKAYDTSGNSGSSSTVNVTVSIPLTTVFKADSFWYTEVPSDAPVHSNNTNLVQSFIDQKAAYYGNVNINSVSSTTPVYIAAADTPTVNVAQWSGNTSFPYTKNPDGTTWTADTNLTAHFTAVPIPSWAIPSDGTDAEMCIYQPSTGKLWEFWMARKNGSNWEARWGGRMDNVSSSNGIWPNPFGASATGLPFIGGQITADELQAGQINHVIGISLPVSAASGSFSWPAARSNGPGTGPIKEGQRFRLDPTWNVDASSLHPVAKTIAKAAQKYGFVVWDYAGAINIRVRNMYSYTQVGQTNPYTALFNGTPDYAIMNGFPWDQLKFLPDNYGQFQTAQYKISSLTDDFNDNTLDPAKWAIGSYEGLPETGVTVVEQNGRLEMSPPANAAGTNYSGVKTVNKYDLTNSAVFVRLTQPAATTVGVETQFVVYNDVNNSISFYVGDNGNIVAGTRVAGTKTGVFTAAYSSSTHAWLRIREASGTTYLDTAPSSASNPPTSGQWVNRASFATPFALTGVRVNLQVGTYISTATPGTAYFDGFNMGDGVGSDAVQPTFTNVKNDMTLPHQAAVHGINPAWSWGTNPRVGLGVSFPGTFDDPQQVVWGIIGTDNAGNPATNVRVQIRKLVSDVRRGGTWTRTVYYSNDSLINGALYTNYETNASVPADLQNHGADGISVKMPSGGGSFHFFTKDRFPIASGAQEIVNRFEARLIIDNVANPDDRTSAKILGCSGGDLWKNPTAQWSSTDYNNDDIAIGRFKYITSDWQMFTSHTLTTDSEVTDYLNNETPLTPR